MVLSWIKTLEGLLAQAQGGGLRWPSVHDEAPSSLVGGVCKMACVPSTSVAEGRAGGGVQTGQEVWL